MRILLVNPNTTKALTVRMAGIAEGVAAPGTTIVPLTAGRGFPYIASQAEAHLSSAVVYEMLAENRDGADAAIIAAFGDPGLAGAKQIFDFPVIGMAEAAVLSAAMLGRRFAIVTFSPVMKGWYADAVQDAGLQSRFTGVRTPATHADNFDGMQDRMRGDLIDLCNAAVREDGAEAVILGGAPLAGLAQAIEAEVRAPLVDPISAATVQAVALASIVSKAGFVGRYHKPLAKPSRGLTGVLEHHFAVSLKQEG